MLKLVKITAFAALFAALPISAVTPSPAMIAQIQNLSPAEQQRLAKQYGIELPAGAGANSTSSQAEPEVLIPKQHSAIREQSLLNSDKLAVDYDQTPKRFGMAMFDSQISTFAPIDNAPVAENYRLGPDDIVLLQLFGKQNSSEELKVSRTGTISLPEIGPVNVNGLTVAQASDLIVNKVREAMIGVDAVVTMGKLRTINIFVAGEAKTPGMFAVSALTNVTQALYVAGGVSEIGSLRDIQVKRNGETVARFDLYNLLLRGDNSGDIQLKHGDVIFVAPLKATVEATGEVKRPAVYEIKSGETIDNLLSMVGGTKAGAYPQSVVLERFDSNNLRNLLNLDLTNAVNKQMSLRDGDVLSVSATSPRIEHQVTLVGAVVRPGQYSWRQGLRVTDLVKSFWADLHMTADLDYALIVREVNDAGDVKVLQFALANAVNQPQSADNIELKPRDLVLVFNYAEQAVNRTALNDYFRKELQKRFHISEDVRWAAGQDLSAIGFSKLSESKEYRAANSLSVGVTNDVGGQKIVDSQQGNEQRRVSEQATIVGSTGAEALPGIMQHVMSKLFYDKDLLALSASFKRTELMYPLIEKLKMQARNGATPLLVRVSGEVRVPGEYPLVEGANLKHLIAAASGLTDSAYLGRAELTRADAVSSNTNSVEVKNVAVNLDAAFKGDEVIQLQSRDRLNVFAIPDWNIERAIEIRGEVKFPGRYTIQRGEMLSDVIERAGGLSRNAFMQGVVYTRESVKERERLQLKKLTDQLRADIATKSLSEAGIQTSPQEAMLMIDQLEKQPPVGRLVLDVPAILAGDITADIPVEDGDLFYIPRTDYTVSVVGEVQHASSHRFKDNMTVDDYLNLAGGLRKRADEERIYVIKANGSVVIPSTKGWFAVKSSQLEPGDAIIVPVDTEYKDSLGLWTSVTQIFYQSAVALAALNSF
ncbi:sugar transporter [Rheinheimera sediminis]|uniref:SLBB domain-containing protein n=1 Tax=Rheinheimera sp. YQF-1 TaxID=2499626 RepID=UPI000FDAD90E|nr:SLBB domain-containing protein [Rheinheimera sp. YQF-1]RVT46928.1 sugar transporter [Rheinheimera sp. YQF-1]